MSFELLTQLFTFDELTRIWFDESVCDSRLNKHFEEHEPLLWKIQNSCWRYGWDRSYNMFVRTLDAFRRIGNDLPPHFSTTITHTRAFNTAAWSAHVNSYDPKVGIYLDGPFGALLYYKGAHVMTIGFSVSTFGIAIAQVQLRQKHGNRFLYKLGANYLDWALDFMARAFEGETLWIVDGASNVAAIRSAYGKCADKIDEEAMARVRRFYDQPLRDYVRVAHDGRRPGADDGRRFVKLAKKPCR